MRNVVVRTKANVNTFKFFQIERCEIRLWFRVSFRVSRYVSGLRLFFFLLFVPEKHSIDVYVQVVIIVVVNLLWITKCSLILFWHCYRFIVTAIFHIDRNCFSIYFNLTWQLTYFIKNVSIQTTKQNKKLQQKLWKQITNKSNTINGIDNAKRQNQNWEQRKKRIYHIKS